MAEEKRDYQWYVDRGIVSDEPVGLFLEAAAGYWPDRELIVFDNKRYSYSEMHLWTLAAAQQLVAAGVMPGDRILIQALNAAELLVIQFAAWRIGAVTVPIVPMYRRHELVAIISDVQPRVIVTSGKTASRCYCSEMDALVEELGIEPCLRLILGDAPYLSGWTELAAQPVSYNDLDISGLWPPATSQQCAVILYTSGSTAAPKGAMLRSGAIVANARAMQKIHGIGADDVALCATPIGHTGALINSLMVPMTTGARAVIMPAWKPDEAVEIIAREGVTYMGAPPLILQDIIDRYETKLEISHKISKFFCGGGAMPPSLILRAEAVGILASRNYGMTETTGTMAASNRWQSLERRAHYDGLTFYGTEVAIVDSDRHVLPYGTIGEIRIRTPLLMIGYTDPIVTAAQMDDDGWFYTGDLGRLDERGWLVFEGRSKDIINRGGEKFSSQDIEIAIASHPSIADVAVVGAPDERFGEVVAAFLRLKPGYAWDGPEGLLSHLEDARLAKQKRPVQWHILDEFPRTPSGKVQKQGLRSMLTA